uniref:Carboxypeptidase n=1 Tax=Grammatophora oceanica TaxID=210454 RepID=A0A7S1YM83_9STRA
MDSMTSWSGHNQWVSDGGTRGLWLNNKTNPIMPMAGYAKELGNLTFVVVYNSGHLVPFHQPENALDLIERFLLEESYIDQAIDRIAATNQVTEEDGLLGEAPLAVITSPAVPPSSASESSTRMLIACFFAGVLITLVPIIVWVKREETRRRRYEPVNDAMQ